MTSYYVEMTLAIDTDDDRAGLEAFLVEVGEAFEDITDVTGDVGVDFGTGRIDFCMTVSAQEETDALGKAVTAARTAVHAAGGSTASWNGLLEKVFDNRQYRSSVAPSTWTLDLC
jgi:hypothetical protein